MRTKPPSQPCREKNTASTHPRQAHLAAGMIRPFQSQSAARTSAARQLAPPTCSAAAPAGSLLSTTAKSWAAKNPVAHQGRFQQFRESVFSFCSILLFMTVWLASLFRLPILKAGTREDYEQSAPPFRGINPQALAR